ncbi:EF-hand domain-containing protein [Thalassomonas sp. M1454]|uniref:EF-hand domain-containing protein n=1 Tax=Thalassomonas sp. M1454 TaxID=2594477 RepID=UPI00118168E3|nr:EF-hand domain-containing protein [Thalassomonas sp. M1454]TRX53946.1 EF-hand domain-containing protein [Thalassomonas sp. M1454]
MKKLITAVAATVALGLSMSASAASKPYFDKLDADGDGYLNKAEYRVNLDRYFAKKGITDPVEKDRRTDNGFKKKDTNKDGKISFEEMNAKK